MREQEESLRNEKGKAPSEPAQLQRPDFPPREPFSSCQARAACPSPPPQHTPLSPATRAPLAFLCFSDPVCVLCLNHGCSLWFSGWEPTVPVAMVTGKLLAPCASKGTVSPPSTRWPLPAPGRLTISRSSERQASDLYLWGGKPCLCQGRLHSFMEIAVHGDATDRGGWVRGWFCPHTPCPKDLHGMQGIKDGLSISLSHIPLFQSILVK